MENKFDNLTNKEKAEWYQKLKTKYAKQEDMTELIKETHKIFLVYIYYHAKKYAKLKNKDEKYALDLHSAYFSKCIFKFPKGSSNMKLYKSDLNNFRRNERVIKATKYYLIIQDSYDIDEIKHNLDLIYDLYIEDLNNDN